jgi:hypothetical protein
MIDFGRNIAGRANLNACATGQNPLAPTVSRRRIQWSAILGAVALVLGTISAPGFAQNWLQEAPDNSPSERAYASMAYDSAERNVVLFGGEGNNVVLADTWVWDGSNWTQMTPSASPSPRTDAAMAFDSVHGQMVLFGGYSNAAPYVYLADTWVWDGSNWTLKTPSNSPPGRAEATMKFDSARGQMVLFGGYGGVNSYGDTWVWNGTSWTQEELSTNPPARQDAAMAYDAAGGNIVLFGGGSIVNSTEGPALNDTWVWNGSQWTEKHPSTSPPGRVRAGMANYSEQGRVFLFGGIGATAYLNDTWSWNGSDWTEDNPQNTPTPRMGFGMAPDDAEGNLVMFGGITNGISSATWIFAKGPEVTLSASSLSFPTQKAKTSSSSESISVTNSGVTNLTIDGVSISGSDKQDFTQTNNCHSSLKIGFSCTINVAFKPTAKGARSAKLVIKDNAQNGSQSVALSGTGD